MNDGDKFGAASPNSSTGIGARIFVSSRDVVGAPVGRPEKGAGLLAIGGGAG